MMALAESAAWEDRNAEQRDLTSDRLVQMLANIDRASNQRRRQRNIGQFAEFTQLGGPCRRWIAGDRGHIDGTDRPAGNPGRVPEAPAH